MKKLIIRILFVFACLILLGGLLLGYAYFVEPRRLIVKEKNLKIPHWSQNLNGFKIVAVSDIHGGSNYVTEERIRRVVELANAQNPDLIIMLGDYVSQTNIASGPLKMPSETVAENLKGLKAKYGVYGIIGNHDWYYSDEKMTGELEAAGITILKNQVKEIKVGDETINLWGIEDYWKNHRVPVEPFEAIADKQNIIAITHNPDSLLKTPDGISIMFAGHSHGGQINFPIYGAYPFVNDKRFMAGEAVVDGRHIFVTSGIGMSGPQFRFRVPPEIAVLNLYAEN